MNYLVGDCKLPRDLSAHRYCRVPTLAEALTRCETFSYIGLPPGGHEVIHQELRLTSDYARVICLGNPCPPYVKSWRSWITRWPGWVFWVIWRLFRKKGYTLECIPGFKSERKRMWILAADGIEIRGLRFETPSDLTTIEMEKGQGLTIHNCMFAALDLPADPDAIWQNCTAYNNGTVEEIAAAEERTPQIFLTPEELSDTYKEQARRLHTGILGGLGEGLFADAPSTTDDKEDPAKLEASDAKASDVSGDTPHA